VEASLRLRAAGLLLLVVVLHPGAAVVLLEVVALQLLRQLLLDRTSRSVRFVWLRAKFSRKLTTP
jgi:hypothetical protein